MSFDEILDLPTKVSFKFTYTQVRRCGAPGACHGAEPAVHRGPRAAQPAAPLPDVDGRRWQGRRYEGVVCAPLKMQDCPAKKILQVVGQIIIAILHVDPG